MMFWRAPLAGCGAEDAQPLDQEAEVGLLGQKLHWVGLHALL